MDASEADEPVIVFKLNARDNGIEVQHSANVTVYVTITRVNEYPPVITTPGKSLAIPEESTAPGTVLYQIHATDLDSGDDGQVSYSISSGNQNGVFSINSQGNLTVEKNIDRETYSGFTLILTASDNAGMASRKQSSVVVVVAISDINDNAPEFIEASYSFDVPENTKIESEAAAVRASDPDYGVNGTVEYSIISATNDGNTLFRISKSSGSIITRQSLDLDALGLTSKTFVLTVIARDTGQPPMNNTVNVTLRIVAVNEFVPTVSHFDDIVMELPSSVIGSTVIDINATDQDYGPDGDLVYSITKGNEDDDFTMNSTSGKYFQSFIISHKAPFPTSSTTTAMTGETKQF